MDDVVKSRRGVYYDLSQSPYEYTTPYGDIFKFKSQKKLDMYTRDIEKELAHLEKMVERHGLENFVPDEIMQLLKRAVYRAFYEKFEG